MDACLISAQGLLLRKVTIVFDELREDREGQRTACR
jgi:hypothetical protein